MSILRRVASEYDLLGPSKDRANNCADHLASELNGAGFKTKIKETRDKRPAYVYVLDALKYPVQVECNIDGTYLLTWQKTVKL